MSLITRLLLGGKNKALLSSPYVWNHWFFLLNCSLPPSRDARVPHNHYALTEIIKLQKNHQTRIINISIQTNTVVQDANFDFKMALWTSLSSLFHMVPMDVQEKQTLLKGENLCFQSAYLIKLCSCSLTCSLWCDLFFNLMFITIYHCELWKKTKLFFNVNK